MIQCKHCGTEFQPMSKSGVFCTPSCRSKSWYEKNKQVTIDRAAQWRKDNPEKMAECRLNWRRKNPGYHSEYTMSWRGDTENARLATEAVKAATELTPEERVELAHHIMDLNLGKMSPNVVEEFLFEVLDD